MEITLNGGDTINVITNEIFDDPGCIARDDSGRDISESVKIKGIADTTQPGTYTISYSVTDPAGNTLKKDRTVIVDGFLPFRCEDTLFLTFDDGPSETVTPEILSILKKYDVPATFFIVDYGQSAEKINMLRSAIAQGHTIGIHGYSHDYSKIYRSVPDFMDNVKKLDDKIRRDLDYEPFIMRFPGGSSNKVSRSYCEGIMPELVKKVQAEGYYFTDWNIYSGDSPGSGASADQIIASVKNVCSRFCFGNILMHDSEANHATAEALPELIEWAKEAGYAFSAMKKGGQTVHHAGSY